MGPGAVAARPPADPAPAARAAVVAAGLRWNVQVAGRGPVLLLLHGTGSSHASWRDLVPLLADRFTLVAPDLPGHGGTSAVAAGPTSLPAVAHALAGLLRELQLAPEFIAGHSAGAAISAQMALAETPQVRRLAWLAAAVQPLDGLAGRVATPLARLLARSAWLAQLAARRAGDATTVRRMIAATGSTLDEHGIAAYAHLLRQPSHVGGALAMMAGWDLAPLQRALPLLAQGVLLLHGDGDRTVAATQSDRAALRLRDARVERLAGLGHLAHEEQPQCVAHRLAHWFATGG